MKEHVPPTLMLEGLYDAKHSQEIHWEWEQVEPLLMFKPEDHHFVPFFSSLILKPLQSTKGRFLCGLQSAFRPVTQADWQGWLDHLFRTDQWLNSIGYVAGKFKQWNVQVWVMLPYPFPQRNLFGEIKGKKTYFYNENDRLQALQWWMEQLTEGWKQHPCSQVIRLRGFVWGREGIPPFDQELIKRWNKLVHQYHLESMWLPNYRATFVGEWRDLGFDHVSMFPQYTGATDKGPEWLANSCKFALVHQTGLQIIDGKGPRFSTDHFREYLRQIVIYRQLGGQGPLVYRFPGHSLYRLFEEDSKRYDEVFYSL